MNPEVICTARFTKDLKRLRSSEQQQAHDKIALLIENPRHPSLNTHRMLFKEGIWECYVNEHIRLVFAPAQGNTPLCLWRVGQHRLVDNAETLGFATERLHPYVHGASTPEVTPEPSPEHLSDPAWSRPREEPAPENVDAHGELEVFSPTILRFFGVPSEAIARVQAVSQSWQLLEISDLPDRTVQFLAKILDDPQFTGVFSDPDVLLYRTTLDAIEGFCEGRLKQLMLNLTETQRRYVEHAQPGITVLRGTAGSGKTTVGVYRAIARAITGRRVLLVTFNLTLVDALCTLVRELEGEIPPTLTIVTADKCLRQTLQAIAPEAPLTIAQSDDQRYAMKGAVSATQGAYDLKARDGGHFLEDEFENVLQARGLTTWAEYRDHARTGRGTPLNKSARRIVWEVYQAYQAALARMKLTEWHTIAQQVRQYAGQIPPERCFDDIIADETQDISLVKLQALTRLLKGNDDTAFWLLTDAAQTIYTRGIWWGDDDLSAPPQRLYLRRNHRNTREIAQAAAALLAHNTRRSREFPSIIPERTQSQGMLPLICRCASVEQQARQVRDSIQNLCTGEELRYSDFVVLCRTNDLCTQVAAMLAGARIPTQKEEDKPDLLENTVKVLTFHSAKGLEWPAVYIMGADAGIVPLDVALSTLEEAERAREIERERSLFYVACTRAATMLTILTTTGRESPFIGEFGYTVQASDA